MPDSDLNGGYLREQDRRVARVTVVTLAILACIAIPVFVLVAMNRCSGSSGSQGAAVRSASTSPSGSQVRIADR